MRKRIRIPVTLTLFIITLTLGTLGYLESCNPKEQIDPYKNIPVIKEESENGENNLEIYVEKENENILCTKNYKCSEEKLYKVIKTVSEDPEIITNINYANYILIKDNNKFKIIDLNNNKIETTPLENDNVKLIIEDQSKYDWENKNKKLLGIIENDSFYNYETKETLYKGNNYKLDLINKDTLVGITYKNGKKETIYILDANKEEIKNKISFDDLSDSELIIYKSNIFLDIINPGNDNTTFMIYDNNLNKVGTINEQYEKATPYLDKIYIEKENKIEIYNYSGSKLKETNLKDIKNYKLILNYIIGTKNKKIIILNTDTDEEIIIDELPEKENIKQAVYTNDGKFIKNKIGIYITTDNYEVYYDTNNNEYQYLPNMSIN